MPIQAELRVPIATVRLIHYELQEPADVIYCPEDSYRLDLNITPRIPNVRASYQEHWDHRRFENVGNLFLAPLGEELHVRSEIGASDSIVCHLLSEPLKEWFGGDLQLGERSREVSLDFVNSTIRDLVLRLGGEARHPGFASEVLAESVAAQIAVELGRHLAALDDQPQRGGIASWRLRIIDDRLREVRRAPTLAELATLCDISVRQLSRGFRISRGCSIGEYVANARLNNAKYLLQMGESVKSIAFSMGFASTSSFCYAFRKSTGLTTGEFQQVAGWGP